MAWYFVSSKELEVIFFKREREKEEGEREREREREREIEREREREREREKGVKNTTHLSLKGSFADHTSLYQIIPLTTSFRDAAF